MLICMIRYRLPNPYLRNLQSEALRGKSLKTQTKIYYPFQLPKEALKATPVFLPWLDHMLA